MDLTQIEEVRQIYCDRPQDVAELNQFLQDGWVLLKVASSDKTDRDQDIAFCYSIGWPRDEELEAMKNATKGAI